MQELFNVILKDDGSLDIKCCDEKTIEDLGLKITSVLIKKAWGEKNYSLSKIIRALSMAEVSACAEPYSQAEESWSTMMFNYIPRTEKYYDSLKRQYGDYRGAKQRPITFGDTSMFEIKSFSKNSIDGIR